MVKRIFLVILLMEIWMMNVGTVNAAEPRGNFDGIGNYTISGWAYDPDEPSKSILVHIYADGMTGGEGIVLGAATANVLRSDVNAAYGITGNHGFNFAIPEKYRVGYHTFYVYAIDSQGGVNPLIAANPKSIGVKPSGNAAISKTVLGSLLTIRTYDSLGGAIGSLVWKGKEFIDRTDHGRELQTACHFDGYGECYNPTEAGSASDGIGTNSSSTQLSYLSTDGGILHTRARMAYWLRPGESSQGCSKGGTARNTTWTSQYVLDKKVEIGYKGMENVIRYDVTVEMPETRNWGIFEHLTGYMPPSFSKFYSFDPVTKTTQLLPSTFHQSSNVPLIFASDDGLYAMGIVTADFPRKYSGSYDAYDFDSVVKWNTVDVSWTSISGDRHFSDFVIVGSLDQVKQSMGLLIDTLVVPSPTPTQAAATPTIDLCSRKRQGDANCDGKIDLADFALWKQEYLGKVGTKTADFDSSGLVGLEDFGAWKKGYLGLY